jgi:hypothetical protein
VSFGSPRVPLLARRAREWQVRHVQTFCNNDQNFVLFGIRCNRFTWRTTAIAKGGSAMLKCNGVAIALTLGAPHCFPRARGLSHHKCTAESRTR